MLFRVDTEVVIWRTTFVDWATSGTDEPSLFIGVYACGWPDDNECFSGGPSEPTDSITAYLCGF